MVCRPMGTGEQRRILGPATHGSMTPGAFLAKYGSRYVNNLKRPCEGAFRTEIWLEKQRGAPLNEASLQRPKMPDNHKAEQAAI